MGLRNEWDNVIDGVVAGQALTAKGGHFVQMVAGGVFAAATAGQQGIVGVLQNAPAVGGQCIICGGGQTTVVAGAVIAKGDPLGSDAAGKAIPAVTADKHIYGYALEAAAGSGSSFKMAFAYHGLVPA